MAQNRIVVPVPAPRNFLQWPWREIALAAIVLIAAAVLVYSGVNWVVSRASESTSATVVPAVEQSAPVSAAQPVQQAPVVEVAPVVKELPKVHVEWIKIGTARNGNEVIALGMPRGDEFISLPVALVENLPPGATGILGFPTGKGTFVLYTYVQTEPWVDTYWKTTTEIPLSALEGRSP